MADEYIRKQDAIVVAESYQVERMGFDLNDYEYGRNQVADSIASDLEDIEPADVAPVVHSRWSDEMERVDTYHPFTGFETDYYHRCLNCGRRGKGFSWNFCPYCGAKMDGKE